MHRFTVFIPMAVLLADTTAGEAATGKKKSGATADRSTASKPKPQRVSKPTAPSRQGWPTSWSDGSFRYHD